MEGQYPMRKLYTHERDDVVLVELYSKGAEAKLISVHFMNKGDTLAFPEILADDVEVVVPEPKIGE
jgi:hypothetical protein